MGHVRERSINPYTPAAVDETSERHGHRSIQGGLSSFRVCTQTIGAIGVSGGLYGIGLVIVSALVANTARLTIYGDLFLFLLTALMFGCVIAAVTAVPVVLGTFAFLTYLMDRGHPWTANRVRSLAAISGFGTGIFSILMLLALSGGLSAPASATFLLWQCLLPAAVGTVGTLLLMEPLARRARREQDLRRQMISEQS